MHSFNVRRFLSGLTTENVTHMVAWTVAIIASGLFFGAIWNLIAEGEASIAIFLMMAVFFGPITLVAVLVLALFLLIAILAISVAVVLTGLLIAIAVVGPVLLMVFGAIIVAIVLKGEQISPQF